MGLLQGRNSHGRKVAASGRHSPWRARPPVRFPPLGSPWTVSKRSYVHVPVVTQRALSAVLPVRAWGGGGVGIPGTGWGGVVPTQYTLPAVDWYCQNPPTVRTPLSASTLALQAPPGPSAHQDSSHSAWPASGRIGRDSAKYILKLVDNPECHLKCRMRPGILPISKTGPLFTTLNFQYFQYGQPSLCRNKWS